MKWAIWNDYDEPLQTEISNDKIAQELFEQYSGDEKVYAESEEGCAIYISENGKGNGITVDFCGCENNCDDYFMRVRRQ